MRLGQRPRSTTTISTATVARVYLELPVLGRVRARREHRQREHAIGPRRSAAEAVDGRLAEECAQLGSHSRVSICGGALSAPPDLAVAHAGSAPRA